MKPNRIITGLVLLTGFLASSLMAQEPNAQAAPTQTQAQAVTVNGANANYVNPPAAAATSVTIGWTLSPSTNIVSQTVSWGQQSTNYTTHMNLAPNQTQFQLQNLQPATTYYIAVMCTQATGNNGTNLIKSYYGNEIVWTTIPTERPVSPQNARVISSP